MNCSITIPIADGFYQASLWLDQGGRFVFDDPVPAGAGGLKVLAYLSDGTIGKTMPFEIGDGETVSLTVELNDEADMDE
jgi:hypothetical protein